MALEGWRDNREGGDFQKARSSLQDLPGEPEVSGDTLRQAVQVSTQMLILITLLTPCKTASSFFPRLTAAKRVHGARGRIR